MNERTKKNQWVYKITLLLWNATINYTINGFLIIGYLIYNEIAWKN